LEGYPFGRVERKWRERWESTAAHRVDLDHPGNKKYVLVMFSYPSEKKLHIGHWWNYCGTDIYARAMKMRGFNAFEPMGFDSFGLPAENFAVKHNVHPARITAESISYIREQIKQIGAMIDWDKEVITSSPEYYRWTQWLFLQLLHHNAAYRKQAPVNWCPQCLTVLANEQVTSEGRCERCSAMVENRSLTQWFFRITDFADALLEGLNRIDWPESTKAMQRHWIGRSEGTEIHFPVKGGGEVIRAFTTRADTLFGVTWLVLAPEHELVERITTPDRRAEVQAYVSQAKAQSELERVAAERDKTGVFTGAYAVNPANGKALPIWIADYVLAGYGTGAVMAVPAHDQRDYEFAEKYHLPLAWVIKPEDGQEVSNRGCAFVEYGVMCNSSKFNGLSSVDGKKAVTEWLERQGRGKATVSYRLRDWSVSRQRYWGAPIPVIHCLQCGIVPVPEVDLPVLLPEEIEDFKPRGASPLGATESFIAATCPNCGQPARRDPDTLDTFVDSSWYFLRYISTDDHVCAFSPERVKAWMPVDVYIGGPEHATGHLIYARYITKFLHSIGLLEVDEPAVKMVHQGIITYNGARMSKSRGNVVNPDEFVERYGADCFRLYLMFMGDFTVGGEWSDEGIIGIRRFQNRVWRLFQDWIAKKGKYTAAVSEFIADSEVNRVLNYTIKELTANLEQFRFNTAISRLMELVNALYAYTAEPAQVNRPFLRETLEKFTQVMAPLAPHLCEELWELLGHKDSVFQQSWPGWDEAALTESKVVIAVQVNGKLTTTVEVVKGSAQSIVEAAAGQDAKVMRRLEGKTVVKNIFVPDRILNIVAQ